jgi:hypothetical protein
MTQSGLPQSPVQVPKQKTREVATVPIRGPSVKVHRSFQSALHFSQDVG